MWVRFQKLPLAISIPTLLIVMMMIPSVHGFISGDSHKGRSFFYAVLLGLFGFTFLILLYIATFLNKNTIAQFAMAAIIAIAYNLPLKSNKNSAFRLRQIKGLKILKEITLLKLKKNVVFP